MRFEFAEKIHYNSEQPCYFPPELVSQFSAQPQTTYHFYLIRMKPNCPRNFHLHDVLLGTRVFFEDDDIGNTGFWLEDHRGTIAVTLSYVGAFHLTQEEVFISFRFVRILSLLNSKCDQPLYFLLFRFFCVEDFR